MRKMAPQFYYNEDLDQFIVVCWCEYYDRCDDEEKKNMRSRLNQSDLEDWIEGYVFDNCIVDNKNLRFAILNTLDYKFIIECIKHEYEEDFEEKGTEIPEEDYEVLE